VGLNQGHNNARRFWLLAAAVATVALLLQAGGTPIGAGLAWDRDALAAGQLWRLFTGHFVHLGWSHLLLNLAGLALVSWLVGKWFSLGRWLLIGAVSIAAIDIGFWQVHVSLDTYVGLSGLLYGLLVAGLLAGVLERDREAIILAAFVIAKIAWEQFAGPMPGSEATTGGKVIVEAHLYGALGGLLAGLLCRYNAPQPARDPVQSEEDS
jgi:rhomboid family GlyGly-CTERM serine protease